MAGPKTRQRISAALLRLGAAGMLIAAMTWDAYGQAMPVPVEIQFALMTRILSYDRTFTAKESRELTVGVLYQSGYRASLAAKEELVAAVRKTGVTEGGLPIRYLVVDLEDEAWSKAEALSSVDLLYVAPLRAADLAEITAFSRRHKIPTFTGVEDYVLSGIAIGFGAKGEKPLIVVNLASTRAEGTELSAQFLRVVKVIR